MPFDVKWRPVTMLQESDDVGDERQRCSQIVRDHYPDPDAKSECNELLLKTLVRIRNLIDSGEKPSTNPAD